MHIKGRFLDFEFPHEKFRFSELPPATKYLTIAYVSFSSALFMVKWLFYQHHRNLFASKADWDLITSPVLQLVPCETLWHPISLVLSNLIDVKFWKFAVNLLNLYVGGAFIERNWQSPTELLRYTLEIGSLTNLAIVLVSIIASFALPQVKLDLPLDGSYTILVGFPIVYKQLVPELTLLKTKNIPILSKNFRFKLLPIFVLSVTTISQIIWFHHFSQLLSIWVTFVTCWVYLRFYQVLPPAIAGTETSAVVGDASETFQLLYFFPDIVKPILRPVFDFSYHIFCNVLRLRQPFQDDEIYAGNALAEGRGAKKVGGRVEERRKRLALQVLGERLQTES
ncbi:LAMI_0B06106g1_1 [Lachancea mirantina]|uniref:LAMI_0B06106g1_1 n=1 Tax=Lachancea mirantina TaxID=1230905 RepID=A0A1G4IWD9_9SACH|nr:LAMI_0B06106g1_1 [Lachancea mirantina]